MSSWERVRKTRDGHGEMGQRSGAFAALAQGLGSIPRIYLAAHNQLKCQFQGYDALFWPLRAPYTHTGMLHIYTLIHVLQRGSERGVREDSQTSTGLIRIGAA